jgi:hypothetical protein
MYRAIVEVMKRMRMVERARAQVRQAHRPAPLFVYFGHQLLMATSLLACGRQT